MSLSHKAATSAALVRLLARPSRLGRRLLGRLPWTSRAFEFVRAWDAPPPPQAFPDPDLNPLRAYYEAHTEGRGIWKWDHYFDIYHRHFARFQNRPVHVLEIGIYSGGSLDMWKEYFGPECCVYGVDIEPACREYEDERTRVFIGDQADRAFWKRLKAEVPCVDILIDDGGHETEQQVVTLEEMLPHLAPGGVFVCEDVTDPFNGFAAYAQGLIAGLNAFDAADTCQPDGTKTRVDVQPTPFQAAIASIHAYPFVTVIEKAPAAVARLVTAKHGTRWQPFL